MTPLKIPNSNGAESKNIIFLNLLAKLIALSLTLLDELKYEKFIIVILIPFSARNFFALRASISVSA